MKPAVEKAQWGWSKAEQPAAAQRAKPPGGPPPQTTQQVGNNSSESSSLCMTSLQRAEAPQGKSAAPL